MSQVKFTTPTALKNLNVQPITTPQPVKITAEQLARFKAALQNLGKSK
jgi:hypothetical protein